MKLINGDSLDKLKELDSNSVDSVVTDPPYGLAFMGKKWDYDVPSVELWREVLRVLKPGGHLLSFGGTRTYHRMVVNIEDAGFEIRDQIQWLYGSGFPKSHNISKGIDKKFGAEREVVGVNEHWGRKNRTYQTNCNTFSQNRANDKSENLKTISTTDAAKQWDGFGTALKPANEPIVLARKPLSEKTIVDNVLKWGTGGINIDGCRVEAEPELAKNWDRKQSESMNTNRPAYGKFNAIDLRDRAPQGRFPANIILDETAAGMLDEQSGVLNSGAWNNVTNKPTDRKSKGVEKERTRENRVKDSGGASRFFYVAKASKRERNAGLENISNGHPCVKPIKLMQYLCRLVTPPKGTVLDPFMGSGTTGIAAKNEGFDFIGIEKEKEYIEIAAKRVEAAQCQI